MTKVPEVRARKTIFIISEAAAAAAAAEYSSTVAAAANPLAMTLDARLQEQWDEMFRRLVAYKHQHGDCNVPSQYPHDKALGKWVTRQRRYLRNAPVVNERRQKLESIGFVWQLVGAKVGQGARRKINGAAAVNSWEQMFQRLVAYQQQHGDCKVPAKYLSDQALANWVISQRKQLQKALPIASNERRQKLDSIGFSWKMYDKVLDWDKVYQRLVAYKEQHGDCNIPREYSLDKSLVYWLNMQRELLKDAPADNERRRKLNDLGISWQVQK